VLLAHDHNVLVDAVHHDCMKSVQTQEVTESTHDSSGLEGGWVGVFSMKSVLAIRFACRCVEIKHSPTVLKEEMSCSLESTPRYNVNVEHTGSSMVRPDQNFVVDTAGQGGMQRLFKMRR